jgi:hypothetical protein
LVSRVAVKAARAVDMLAVAVQLLLVTALGAPSRTEPEPSPGAASTSRRQKAGAKYLVLATTAPFTWLSKAKIGRETLRQA